MNGSPIANPLKLGFDMSGWLSKVVETGKSDADTKGSHLRANSIVVRTASTSSAGNGPSHQRTNSQASVAGPSHSRTNSATNRSAQGFVPTRNGGLSQSHASSQQSEPHTPSPPPSPGVSSLPLAAVVAVPTADGHLLEFDPFQTSPGEIDALEDISESAKQQAKDDMRRLVTQAMERWKIA